MKIFIGCSASDNIKKEYFDSCKLLLEEVFSKDNDLVFGACNSGLMGLAYETAKKHERAVIGVCPEAYKEDFKSLDCIEEIITKSIEERTRSAIDNSDASIFLPGGIGTIYELFAAIECKRCHEFDKPIVIFNSNGYFDKLLEFLEKIYEEKFALIKAKDNYFVSDSIPEILNYIKLYYGEIKQKKL